MKSSPSDNPYGKDWGTSLPYSTGWEWLYQTYDSKGMAMAAFQNRLNREGSKATRKLLIWLMKYPPDTWDEIHNAYYAKVNANDENLNRPTRDSPQYNPNSRGNVWKMWGETLRYWDHVESDINPTSGHPFLNFRRKDGHSRPRSDIHRNDWGMPSPCYLIIIFVCYLHRWSTHLRKSEQRWSGNQIWGLTQATESLAPSASFTKNVDTKWKVDTLWD